MRQRHKRNSLWVNDWERRPMARRGTLCGARSFLPAATDTETALQFPLCCKRHAFSLHVEERDKNRLQPGQNSQLWRIHSRYKFSQILTKNVNFNQNIHLGRSCPSTHRPCHTWLCYRPLKAWRIQQKTFRGCSVYRFVFIFWQIHVNSSSGVNVFSTF